MNLCLTKAEVEAEWDAACHILPITVWLRNAGDAEDECWMPCAKGDPGAVLFEPVGGAGAVALTQALTSPERSA